VTSAPHPKPRVVAVVQARTGSTRLPGKVLLPLAGRSVLGWVLRAAQAADGVDEVVVATSTLPGDDAVAEAAGSAGVRVVRGSESDVVSRFRLAAEVMEADAVVRLTADCPLLDPGLIGLVAAAWRTDQRYEYVATTLVRTLPRGLDVELVTTAALRRLDAEAIGHDRVHVTSALYAPGSVAPRLGLVVQPDASDLRVTVDTGEDLDAVRALVAELGDRAPAWRQVVDLLRNRPDIAARNAGVRQKALEDG